MYVTQWGDARERECEREREREKKVSRLGGRWCLLCFSLAFSRSTPSPHTHTHSRARRKVHKYASFNDESKTPASLTIAALKCETMICNSQTFWSPFKLDELSIFFTNIRFTFASSSFSGAQSCCCSSTKLETIDLKPSWQNYKTNNFVTRRYFDV